MKKKKAEAEPRKPNPNPTVLKRQFQDLAWLHENTGISQEAYERKLKALIAQMESR